MVGKKLKAGSNVVRNENENLKRQMEQMKNEDDKRKDAGVYE